MAVFIGAYFLGIPLLNWLNNVDISEYKSAMLILVVAGGINAVGAVFYNALATVRRQRLIFFGYLVASGAALASSNFLVIHYGLNGAAWSFMLSMTFLAVIFGVVLLRVILREEPNAQGAVSKGK